MAKYVLRIGHRVVWWRLRGTWRFISPRIIPRNKLVSLLKLWWPPDAAYSICPKESPGNPKFRVIYFDRPLVYSTVDCSLRSRSLLLSGAFAFTRSIREYERLLGEIIFLVHVIPSDTRFRLLFLFFSSGLLRWCLDKAGCAVSWYFILVGPRYLFDETPTSENPIDACPFRNSRLSLSETPD